MLLKCLSLCIIALAVLQSIRAEDTVSSGNYLITKCNSGQPDSEASKLQKLLPQVYNGLQKVIADLQLGTTSTHGYSAFFKNDSSKAEVELVYQNMAAGSSVVLGPGRNIDPISLRHPTFICANNVPETEFLYQYCAVTPNTPLMYWMHTELMPLCQQFWTIKKQARLSDCPLLVANTLTPNDDRLLQNQEALLVGNLVHLYHDFYPNMIAKITDASELSASESLTNPATYALYYAAVQAGCTNFPNMQKPHDELRRILEVPANSSNTNTTQPIFFEIPSSVPVPSDINTLQNFCNDAVYAPNVTVCCDESTGLWVPAPVIRDGPATSSMSASCPQTTAGTGGVGAGSGVINTRRRRKVGAQ
ncbi:MAG: hypothetical protein ASARMPRED_005880 [Alectoria sarmentosa]|nr:MAG: hypothetical protein ASARMPRED_005880 [Alectoria sarmentosa]